MKKKTIVAASIAAAALVAGAGAAAMYFKPTFAAQAKAEGKTDIRNDKFVTLDKVIVMLRRAEGETASHYMAVDLVFRTTVEKEKQTREQFPLLRSVALKALSGYTYDAARAKTIDNLVADLNQAYNPIYSPSPQEKPFSEVMIGKLIVE